MKKRIIAVCAFVMCMLTFTGCEAKEVIEDILSVNEAEIRKDNGPKVTISKPTEKSNATDTQEEVTATPTPTPTPTEEPQNLIYCISPVNVRAGSNNEAQIIGALAAGDAVEKLGQERGWVKIRYEGQEAWVYEKYVTSENQ